MTLTEKYIALTPGQREQFAAVKDAAALDAFLAETGMELTAEEKARALEYAQTGAMPLSDDDLDAIAGGGGKGGSPSFICGACGYTEYMTSGLGVNMKTKCPSCGKSTFATVEKKEYCNYCKDFRVPVNNFYCPTCGNWIF